MLLPLADALGEVDAELAERLTPALTEAIVGLVPDSWLAGDAPASADGADRAAYVRYLTDRLAAPRAFVEEALRAR